MKLWICGQLKEEYTDEGTVWEFQGVFSEEIKANQACIDETYFYFSANLDEEIPKESVDAEDAHYPRIEEILGETE